MKHVCGIICVVVCVNLLSVSGLMAQEGPGMVTGSLTGTYFRFGQEIAEVAKDNGLDIIVKESEGSIANIKRLCSKENAAFAIVQSDVLGFLKRNPEMAPVAERLRLIFPFYNEEVHLFAQKDIQRFADLEGKRVVFGTEGSGNWLTTVNLFHLMDVEPGETLRLAPPDAVKAVLKGEADAMVYVAGKPVTLFNKLDEVKAELPHLIENVHFVPLDDPKMLAEYVASDLDASDYDWLEASVPTIAVKAVLVCFDFSSQGNDYYALRCRQLATLGGIIRQNLDELKRQGHPKWQEVNLDAELGLWELDRCSRTRAAKPSDVDEALDRILKEKW
jgi:uncharacterized protein